MFKYFRLNLNKLNTFSIAQMAQFAGIKPHTIRIWEQRYGGLTPARTKGNTRFYDDVQLRRLLNIVSLQDQGFKVSELCLMSDADLFNLAAKVMEKPETDLNNGYIVAQLVRAAIDFDEAYFNHHITHSFLRLGVESSYKNIIHPLLTRLGTLWSLNEISASEEHFVTNLIRQKLITAIDGLPLSEPQSDSWLLFLPEDEWHDLGLLFAHYIIRKGGYRSVFLGANVPVEALQLAIERLKPEYLLCFKVASMSINEFPQYIQEAERVFTGKHIYVSGGGTAWSALKGLRNVTWLTSPDALIKIFEPQTVKK